MQEHGGLERQPAGSEWSLCEHAQMGGREPTPTMPPHDAGATQGGEDTIGLSVPLLGFSIVLIKSFLAVPLASVFQRRE